MREAPLVLEVQLVRQDVMAHKDHQALLEKRDPLERKVPWVQLAVTVFKVR